MSEPTRGREGTEEVPYVDDRVSKLWVLLIAAVFAAILIFGLLFGRAGLLAPGPSPSPSPVVSPGLGPSPSPAGVPSPVVSPGPTSAPSPAAPTSPTPPLTPSPS